MRATIRHDRAHGLHTACTAAPNVAILVLWWRRAHVELCACTHLEVELRERMRDCQMHEPRSCCWSYEFDTRYYHPVLETNLYIAIDYSVLVCDKCEKVEIGGEALEPIIALLFRKRFSYCLQILHDAVLPQVRHHDAEGHAHQHPHLPAYSLAQRTVTHIEAEKVEPTTIYRYHTREEHLQHLKSHQNHLNETQQQAQDRSEAEHHNLVLGIRDPFRVYASDQHHGLKE